MLTPAQIDQYHTFGFLILRQCLGADEVARLRRELPAQMEREYPGMPVSDQRRDFCCMLGEHNPTFQGLLEDQRFLDVAEQLHGPSVPVWCDGNHYAALDTPWHPDLYAHIPDALEHAGVKFIHYLEPLDATNGALRVIPGSHLRPYHDRVAAHLAQHRPEQPQLPAVACATQPGDVIAFHQALYHAAFAVRMPRWMHTLAYFPLAVPPAQRAGILKSLTLQVADMRTNDPWRGEVFPDHWIAGAAHHPRRRLLLERLLSTGILGVLGGDVALAELTVRSAEPAARPVAV